MTWQPIYALTLPQATGLGLLGLPLVPAQPQGLAENTGYDLQLLAENGYDLQLFTAEAGCELEQRSG